MSGKNKWIPTKVAYDVVMKVAKGWTPAALQECKTSADNIQKEAFKNAPKLSGTMARGIVVVQVSNGYRVVAKVDYTIFQEEGTQFISGKHFIKKAVEKEMPNFKQAPVRIFKKLGLK